MKLRSAIFAAAALLCVLNVSPSQADIFYVAADGTVNGACFATQPCSSFDDALAIARPGDTIVCISPPQLGSLNITKSITIDCSGAGASVREIGVGFTHPQPIILINIAASSNDPFRTVRLRGLNIDGGFHNSTHILDRGIDIVSATAVYIDDCIISNFNQQGIIDRRTGGQTKLFIKDTVVSDNNGAGIVAAAAAPSVTVLDNVTSENNVFGIAAATGNRVEITHSVFSGNSVVGVEGDAGSLIVVSNSTISHNNIGVQSAMSVRFGENYISFNNTAFSGLAATLGRNRYSGNVSMGTAPSTAVPNAPADIGP